MRRGQSMNSKSMDAKRAFPDARQASGSTVILDKDGTVTADGGAERDASRNKAIAGTAGLRYIESHHRKPGRRLIDAMPVERGNQPLIVTGGNGPVHQSRAYCLAR
jgi:hypothetical protein